MKIAISGKGGVGKTTVASSICRLLASRGTNVLAIDADMDPNLPAALGFTQEIKPISQMKELIRERMGVDPRAPGIYKLNPFVSDIPGKFAIRDGSLTLVVMGGIERGGSGCACPENSFLREILTHVMLGEEEWVVVDMEAGVEHMGRATARAVDVMAVVAEPTPRALQTVEKVSKLGADIGVRRIGVIGNKIRSGSDVDFLRDRIAPLPLIGWIPFTEKVREIETSGKDGYSETLPADAIEKILEGLVNLAKTAV